MTHKMLGDLAQSFLYYGHLRRFCGTRRACKRNMRLFIGFSSVVLSGTLIAQVVTYENVASTKDIMTAMVIPASNALFGATEKPTDQEWAELRKQALILAEAGNLLMMPGRMAPTTKGKAKGAAANAAAWNQAAKTMRDAGQRALSAIDQKDTDLLAGNVSEQILTSCSSCHEKYMIK